MRDQNFIKLVLVVLLLATGSCAQINESQIQPAAKTGPKNIILMVADGIGFNGWLATDYYQGLAGKQSYQIVRPDQTKPLVFGLAHSALNLIDENGNPLPRNSDVSLAAGAVEQGYDPNTQWQRFENAMLNDFQDVGSYTSYTDSAAAGTALMSGRKTSVGRINKNWQGTSSFKTIAEIAMDRGLSAGAVTSVMVSHATPASVIAHNISRNNYADIFNEMIASDLDVIMGAGHPFFDASGTASEAEKENDYKYVGGEKTYETMISNAGLNGFTFIDTKADFETLATSKKVPERVVGIARSSSTLQAGREGLEQAQTPSGMSYNAEVPNLATMSQGALNVLRQDNDGFFLMIEGGAVDWMGHANNMPRFIEEQIDFNLAVAAVIDWVEENSSWDETLLIITSDHECGGIWGEGTWTNGVGGPVAEDRSDEALKSARYHPDEDEFNDFLAVQNRGKGNLPGFQWASPYHTNELVPLFVLGSGGEQFAQFTRTDLKAAELWGENYNWDGNYVDNTAVFHVMESVLMGTKKGD